MIFSSSTHNAVTTISYKILHKPILRQYLIVLERTQVTDNAEMTMARVRGNCASTTDGRLCPSH